MLYQLSYWSMLCPKIMERVKGIGPSQPAWKAGVLPLNYTRNIANIEILSQCNLCVKNYSKYFKKFDIIGATTQHGGCTKQFNIEFPKGRDVLQVCHKQRTCRQYVRDLPICNVISCHEFLSFLFHMLHLRTTLP